MKLAGPVRYRVGRSVAAAAVFALSTLLPVPQSAATTLTYDFLPESGSASGVLVINPDSLTNPNSSFAVDGSWIDPDGASPFKIDGLLLAIHGSPGVLGGVVGSKDGGFYYDNFNYDSAQPQGYVIQGVAGVGRWVARSATVPDGGSTSVMLTFTLIALGVGARHSLREGAKTP